MSSAGSGPANPVTSGITNFDPPGTDVIAAAFRRMGVINDTEVPSAAMYADAISTLNSMFKELEATGIHVWTEEEAVLFLQLQQVRYLVSATSVDHIADAFSYSLAQTNVSAAAGATSVTMLAGFFNPGVTNFFAPNNQIGVVLDSGSVFWTTVSGPPTNNGLTIPLTAALPSSSSGGNFAFAYVSNIDRPLRVPMARRIAWGLPPIGPLETPLTKMMARQQYMDQPNKNTPGIVTQAYYNPSRITGQLYTWPSPQDVLSGLRFTYYRPIQTIQDVDDLADLPQEWGNALKWTLAKELGPGYSVPAERWDRIVQQAGFKAELVLGWDREPESVYFGRSMDQTAR